MEKERERGRIIYNKLLIIRKNIITSHKYIKISTVGFNILFNCIHSRCIIKT